MRRSRSARPSATLSPLFLASVLACAAAHAQEGAASEARLTDVTVRAALEDATDLQLRRPVANGALGDRSALDTPYSSRVVTAETIEQTTPNKLGDVFFTDASVSDNSASVGAWASYLTVRGLELDWQNGYRIDGHPFISYVTVLPYEHMEQVELLKGATGFMYGFGAPGGLVNYVTKKPTAEPVRSVTLGVMSQRLWRGHADLGGRLGQDGQIGYRLNATREEGDTFNEGHLRRNALSLALDARLSRDLTWDFQALYQDRLSKDAEPTITTFGITGGRLPSPVDNDNGRMVGPGAYADNTFKYVSTGLKYQIAPDWQVRTAYSHSSTRTRRNESVLNLLDAAGNYSNDRSDYGESYQFNQLDAQVQGRLRTGGISHQIVAGASWQQQGNDYSSAGFYGPVGTGNLGTQNNLPYYSVGDFGSLGLYRAAETTQKTVYASDTVALNEQWSVLAGLRYTNYVQRSFSTSGAESSRYSQSGVLTPSLALMYRFAPQTMAYASYVEALEPGTAVTNLAYTNYGAVLDPLKSRQYELGVKTERAAWSATAAVFRIEKKAEYVNASNTLVQDGESTLQGVELGATARLGRPWRVGGSLMLLDPEYGRGNAYAGNRVVGAPKVVATAQVAYRVPQLPGLQLTAGVKHTGPTMLRPANDLRTDGFTLLNLGATYDTVVGGHDTTFRFALNNAADKRYWLYQYGNYVKAGDPRSFNLSATVRF
ncbi:TonB-dependent receptor [Paracidovorax wautersii]|uniref:Iron complex outermembrane receptor protein n=1 Tax=Paracidovorax wautersii TaxID=1177982 RepID=A0ABU1IFM1_9BURK|nr:TonB-dependent receptor [Paracidovorax wautersii]MDR6216019.1 iron complex outermembrane receptor protein [Paracidovorax wautersii]